MKPANLLTKSLLLAVLAVASTSFADNVDQQINGLGGNPNIVRRAKKLEPQNKVAVVQNREVDRNWRLELGVNYGMVAGGDSYLSTKSLGASADLHINPHWSLGVRYYDFSNSLTSEGQHAYDQAQAAYNGGTTGYVPQIADQPKDTTLGVVNWYPIYGKINMFDSGVAQFDIYLLGGGGQMQLTSGSTSTWTAGGGVGFWLTNHFTTRLETRYQAYQANPLNSNSPVNENTVVTTFSIGFLL